MGYGKLETVGAFLVSAILLFAGISVGWSSLLQIFEFVLPTHLYEIASHIQIGHDHSHGHGRSPISVNQTPTLILILMVKLIHRI